MIIKKLTKICLNSGSTPLLFNKNTLIGKCINPGFYFATNNDRNPKKQKKPQQKNINIKIRTMGMRNRLTNGPLLRKLNYFNNILNKLGNIESEQKYKFRAYLLSNLLFLPVCMLLMYLFYKYQIKESIQYVQSKNSLLKKAASKASTGQAVQTAQYEEALAKIKKIYIESKEHKIMSSQSEHKEDETEESKNQGRKVIRYHITMIDRDGKQFVLAPYFGDPKFLLKYIEDLQEKYHVLQKAQIFYDKHQKYTYSKAFSDAFRYFAPFLPIAIIIFIFRKTDPTSFLKNLGASPKQFKIQAMRHITTKFKDVAGMEQAKKQITEFVDFLKNNEKYKQMGAKIPKGALLTGPPGTGKTMLAKACAGQANVAFFYISGSEFVEIFVGLGSAKVRDLFAKARQNAPSIIFIDEIDAIGKKRQTSRNEEKDTTLNQLLVEMDGFSSNQTIVVLAATNRKETLDNALTRPGRFDRMVEITLPDVKARQQIFMVHLKPLKIDPSLQVRAIAKRLSELSPGFSGADIANLCNQSAIIAARKKSQFIIEKDFEEAAERITAGYVKKNLMKQKTKKRVAYHQAGHAVASWFLKGGDPLVKLTIIPRSKGALGYAQYMPKTTYIMARSQLIDKVAIMLGGLTSQQIFFGSISSGGSDDLQKVYSLTRRMITQFGMGNQLYNITIDQQSYIQKQSTFLTNKMEEQIQIVLEQAKKRCRNIIEQKKQIIQLLAKQLMEKQTLNKDQILKVMGDRPDFEPVKQQIEKQPENKKQAVI